VSGPGASRKWIARSLTTAYADGLLSDDTFVERLGCLRARLIYPSRLLDDLRRRRAALASAGGLLRAATATARARVHAARGEPRPFLLALDWRGEDRELLIGRHEACDVVLLDPSVSRLHARLLFRDGGWVLHDLESTNGTTVNGVRVDRCRLEPGDDLVLGAERLTID
jgi:hypothetical protein